MKCGRKYFHRVGLESIAGWKTDIGWRAQQLFLVIYKPNRTAESYYRQGVVGKERGIVAFQQHYGGEMLAAIQDGRTTIPVQVNHPVCAEEPTPDRFFGVPVFDAVE